MCDVAFGGYKKGFNMRVEKKIARVIEKKQLNKSYWWFELEFEEEFKFEAGQYVSVKVGEKGERRSYSIATAPSGKKIGLLVKILPDGVGGRFLSALKVGEKVEVLGPLGRFVVEKTGSTSEKINISAKGGHGEEKSFVFVGAGSGIAPLKAMVEDQLQNRSRGRDCGLVLVWGMRYEEDIFWKKEFEGLERKYKNFRFILTLSKPGKGWQGKKGRVTDVLEEMKLAGGMEFYLCGSNQMVEDCQKVLVDKGASESKIHFEKYG